MKRTDLNQKGIVDFLRRLGFSVLDLHEVGKGCPDLLIAKNNVNYLIEIKSEKGKLNKLQLEFHRKWNADIIILHSIDEAIKIFNETT